MPVFVAVDIAVHDPEGFERYKALAPATMIPFGGRYALRGGTVERLEGMWQPSRFVLLEFPTAAAARAWWNSPEYAPVKALRQACAKTEMVLFEGPALDPAG